MSFSLFTCLFLAAVLPLFYLARGQMRVIVLLAASFAFCWFQNERAVYFLAGCAGLSYIAGLASDYFRNTAGKKKISKVISAVTVILLIGILVLYKFSFRILAANALFSLIPDPVAATSATEALLSLYFSAGISYYIFQSAGYLADVAAGKIRAERNPFHFFLYLSYFPKFLSGPIERAGDFLIQLKSIGKVKLFDSVRFSEAFGYLVYGYFLKVMAADRITPYRETLFSNPQDHSPVFLIIGSLLYTMEIYCDFAGYSSIAIGISELFGIRLCPNFQAPYCSANITEFWRRWHMSLSGWLRDYIYIPLGGNRKGTLRRYLNTMVVFLVCGLWHGLSWNFLVWGLLHGIVSVLRNAWHAGNRKLPGGKAAGRILTFVFVNICWIFFGMKDLTSAGEYLVRIITGKNGYVFNPDLPGAGNGAAAVLLQEGAAIGLKGTELVILLCVLAAVILTDAASYRKGKAFPLLWQETHYLPRYALTGAVILCILVFGIYGPGYQAGSFMYMSF